MPLKRIKFFQGIVVACSTFLTIFAVCLFIFHSKPLLQKEFGNPKRALPPLAFSFSPEDYAAVGEPVLYLKSTPPRLHLPDLRSFLIYFGRNGRPDAAIDTPKLYFGFQGNKSSMAVAPNQKIYLVYDKKLSPCKYTFSPENQETMLWFVAEGEGNEANIKLAMRDSDGSVIEEADGLGAFRLTEKEFIRTANQGPWDIGQWRVDGTLLARQKARWMGIDRFLEKHGGEEFSDWVGKQRIDFGDAEECYSVYVRIGDCLIWNDEKWQAVKPGAESLEKPLLVVKKVEDRVMMLELWDAAGKGKVCLNLIRMPENSSSQNVASDFRFLGARTKTQVVFEINRERMILKPNDWLVLTNEGWRKLKTADEIDDYVNRKIIGPLFVFEDVVRKEDKHVLVGTVFTPNRTEMHSVEVAMASANALPTPPVIHEKSPEHQKIDAVTPIATHN